MALIVLFTDFDGTITQLPGAQVVFTPFYRSLLVNPPEQQYKNVAMKSEEEVLRLFREQFDINSTTHTSPGDKGFLITEDAIAFFHNVLSNADVKVHIISRNRDDYIRALFSYHGFSPSEISRLAINCREHKQIAVANYLTQIGDDISKVYVLDDDPKDYELMMQAVKHLANDKIVGVHEAPGTFTWHSYLEQIQAELQKNKESTAKLENSYQKMHELSAGSVAEDLTEINHFSAVFAAVNMGKTEGYDGTDAVVSPMQPK